MEVSAKRSPLPGPHVRGAAGRRRLRWLLRRRLGVDDHRTAARDHRPAPEPVGGLVAEIGTNRLYAVHRAFGLALRNVADEPVVVQEMQLDSDLFATLPPTERR